MKRTDKQKKTELLKIIFNNIEKDRKGKAIRDLIIQNKENFSINQLMGVIVDNLPEYKDRVRAIVEDKRTLKDWLPEDVNVFSLPKNQRQVIMMLMNKPIVEEHDYDENNFKENCPFNQQYITTWVKLENDYAIAFNQNPKLGWTLPYKRV